MATIDDQLLTNNVESTPARAFSASDLVACPACSRANPPTRADCLYCGRALGINVEVLAPTAPATVSETEAVDVVNVVAVPARFDGGEVSAEIAQLLSLAPTELSLLLSGTVAPLYATTETKQAQAIFGKLLSIGIEPVTISDAQLNLATPPKQIAGFAIDNDALTASVRRTGERVSIPWNELVLIVRGRLYFTTTEVEQKRDKSKQVVDERQMTADEAVLDVYSRTDETGWRIRAGSFDFSCLGADKKPTAFENFNGLTELLQRMAVNAVFDDGYRRVFSVLNKVWPLESRANATETRRAVTRDVNSTATVSDNELQFNRYSRLLRLVHASESQDNAGQS